MKYAGMAFEMAAFIVIGVLIGRWLDGKFENENDLFSIFLAILFLIFYFIKLAKDLNSQNAKS